MTTQKRKRGQMSLPLASQYRDPQEPKSKRAKLSRNPMRIASNNNSLRHRRGRGLPRPKTPLSFTLPTRDITTAKPASPLRPATLSPTSSTGASNSVDHLRSIIRVLSLIIRRNKNQHRNQPFWKYLSVLHRTLRKLCTLQQQIVSLTVQQQQQQQQHRPSSRLSAEDVRKRFEAESRLRSQKEVVEEHVREVLVPECYVHFSVVVADTQFANLGVVLVGLIAEVAGVVGLMKTRIPELTAPVQRKPMRNRGMELDANRDSPRRILGTSMKVTGEDQGEIVQRIYGVSVSDVAEHDEQSADDLGEPVQRSDSEPSNKAELAEPSDAEATAISHNYEDYRKADDHDTTSYNVQFLSGTSNKRNAKRNFQPKPRSVENDSDRSKTSKHDLASASTPTVVKSKLDTKAKAGKSTENKKKKSSAFDDLFKGLI